MHEVEGQLQGNERVAVRKAAHDTWELSFSSTASLERIFDYVVDFKRHVEWEEELLDVTPIGSREGCVGAVYVKQYGVRPKRLLQRIFWTPVQIDCTIMAMERPKRISWRQQLWRDQASESYHRQTVHFSIEPQNGRSHVVVIRELMADDSVAVAAVSKAYEGMQRHFRRMPAEAQQQLLALSREHDPDCGPARAGSADEAAGELLDNLPIRGPGARSLTSLKRRLDDLDA